MNCRLILLCSLCLWLSAPCALAAGGGGGGVDGGGGGGKMVPDKDRSGPKLTRIFEEGVALLVDGECKVAEKKFIRVLKKVPRNSEANYLRGVALQCQEKHKQATRYFKRAKRDNARFYRAYAELGMSYLILDRPDLAREQLRELDRRSVDCRQRCPADLLKAVAKLRQAIHRVEGRPLAVEAPAAEPTANAKPSTTTNRPTSSAPTTPMAPNKPTESITPTAPTASDADQHGLLFEQVAEPQTAYLRAVTLINAERFPEAIDALNRLAASLGPHPDVLNYLGYANRRLERFDLAKTYYEPALAIDPLHRGANEYLGEMWVELGRIDEASERLAVLEKACPFGCVEYEDLRRLIEVRVVAAN